MKTIVAAPIGQTGVCRAVGDDLRAIAAIFADDESPAWEDPRLHRVVGELRRTIDQQLGRDADELPAIAAHLGLDFDELLAAAADHDNVRRWVTVLIGPMDGRTRADVIAEILIISLFPDELAYIGLLARAIGPAERAVAFA